MTSLKEDNVKSYYGLLFEAAKDSCNYGGGAKLEHKVVLAIAVRVKAEEYLRKIRIGQFRGCKQFGELVAAFKKMAQEKHGAIEQKYLSLKDVLERVSIVVPEYIHVNSFMYEPLIDTDVRTLIDLYNEVSTWNVKKEKEQ